MARNRHIERDFVSQTLGAVAVESAYMLGRVTFAQILYQLPRGAAACCRFLMLRDDMVSAAICLPRQRPPRTKESRYPTHLYNAIAWSKTVGGVLAKPQDLSSMRRPNLTAVLYSGTDWR